MSSSFGRQEHELRTNRTSAESRQAVASVQAETDAALSALFDTGTAGISEVELATGRFTRVNRRFCEMMRREAGELLTMGPRDVIHPDDLATVGPQWIEAMRGSGHWEAEVRHLVSGGGVIWARIGVSVWKRDEHGVPLRCIAVLQDITDSVLASERLRLSEELLRMGQQVGRIGSFSRDLTTGLLSCGAETRHILGLPPGDGPVAPEVWMARLVPEDRERIIATMREAIDRREPELAYEYRIRRFADGCVRHIEVRACYNYDAGRQPVRSIGVAIDVTERKEAEERLHASEMMMRMCMKIGKIGAFRQDLGASRLFECGPETRLLHGLPSGQEPIAQETWVATLVPEDARRIGDEVGSAHAMHLPELSLQYRFRRPGEATVRHMEARAHYDYDHDGRPMTSIGVVIDVTERQQAEQRLAYAARHDALTDLPNRVLFRDRMCELLARSRRGEGFALLCLDLDHFKEVNDTLGHPAGDRLLKEASARFQSVLRDVDMLARLGGDEFAVIQSSVREPKEVAALAWRLLERIADPFFIDGQQVVVGVSIGIAVAPGDGTQYEELLKAADMALYQAKAEGRGRLRYFEPEMNTRLQTRRALQVDLRRALMRSEFELFYQPIVDVSTRRVRGLEALIRWRHPERGLVPPNEFIPLCEEIGLIVPLGAWVLRRACADAIHWPGGLYVAVNLSPAQFSAGNLHELVVATLNESGLSADRLELEITETLLLQRSDLILDILHNLKQLGVRIVMDDFGTGYSSLSYLQTFPFDKVKIDRAFIKDLSGSPKSRAIVRAMAALFKGLQMSTTAEGVETEEQFEAIRRKGCKEAQGFLFSAARCASDVPIMLEQMRSWLTPVAA